MIQHAKEGMLLAAILLVMLVGDIAGPTQSSAHPQSPAAASQQTAENPWPPPGVYRPGNGVTRPRLIGDSPKPSYTADAVRENVQGLIGLEAVVLPDGKVGEIRVNVRWIAGSGWMMKRSRH